MTWNGQEIVKNTIDLPTPVFLTPGQSYSSPVTDFDSLSNVVDVGRSTYLDSECAVVTWLTSTG
jgi:hypothetical protein